MRRRIFTIVSLAAVGMWLVAAPGHAQVVGGGGPKATDCFVTFDSVPAPNTPVRSPKHVKCADQDVACGDQSPLLGYCGFQLQLEWNSTGFDPCTPTDLQASGFHIPYSGPANDDLPKNITDFEFFQNFANNNLDLTSADINFESGFSNVAVPLKIAFTAAGPVFRTTTIQMHPTMCKAALSSSNNFKCPIGVEKDVDTFKLTCTPPVDSMGVKISACSGIASTFQQLQEHIFDRKCASQPTCHGTPSSQHDLCLRADCGGGRSTYTDLVNVTPHNFAAASDGLMRVDSTSATNSLIVHKINGGAQLNSVGFGSAAYGLRMPYNDPAHERARPKLTGNEIKLITDWIVAGAPQTGFVTTTAKGACH